MLTDMIQTLLRPRPTRRQALSLIDRLGHDLSLVQAARPHPQLIQHIEMLRRLGHWVLVVLDSPKNPSPVKSQFMGDAYNWTHQLPRSHVVCALDQDTIKLPLLLNLLHKGLVPIIPSLQVQNNCYRPVSSAHILLKLATDLRDSHNVRLFVMDEAGGIQSRENHIPLVFTSLLGKHDHLKFSKQISLIESVLNVLDDKASAVLTSPMVSSSLISNLVSDKPLAGTDSSLLPTVFRRGCSISWATIDTVDCAKLGLLNS